VPTYQYACTECGDQIEAVQKFTDAPLSTCSACGGRLRKVFSPVGIVFKGSGFYRTDSRNGSGAPSAAKESADTTKESADKRSGDAVPAGSGSANGGSGGTKSEKAASAPAKASSGEKAALSRCRTPPTSACWEARAFTGSSTMPPR
jgi:putative FmdB family regulatory protein